MTLPSHNKNIAKNTNPTAYNNSVHITKFDGPLIIDTLSGPCGSKIGLTNCPGRRNNITGPRSWNRDLIKDVKFIKNWGADVLISLNENQEFKQLGVPNFPEMMKTQKFDWYHLPIQDFSAPGEHFRKAWSDYGTHVLKHVNQGSSILVHCAAGLGRTGTFVAKLLTTFGWDPAEAINEVRRTRPGAIERKTQEQYIMENTSLKK